MSLTWDSVLAAVRERLPESAYTSWFEVGCDILRMDSEKVEIAVPHDFARRWFERKYSDILEEAIELCGGGRPELSFSVCPERFCAPSESDAPAISPRSRMPEVADASAAAPASRTGAGTANRVSTHPEYRLERFVSCERTRFAFAACQRVVENPGEYSPLLIHGTGGVGKSHLLQGVCAAFQERYPEQTCLHFTADSFLREFTDSVRSHQSDAFRKRLRGCDLLAVDDIHHLGRGNRMATQEELLGAFDALAQAGRQMIFSCDCPPLEVEGLAPRLASRLSGGLAIELGRPDRQACERIVAQRMSERGVLLEPEHAVQVVEAIGEHPRLLEGAVGKLAALVQIGGLRLNSDIIASAIGHQRKSAPRVDMGQVVKATGAHFGVSPESIRERKRSRLLCRARQIAMLLCRRLTSASLAEIGVFFNGRRHSTVVAAIRQAPDLADREGTVPADIEAILLALGFAPNTPHLLARQADLFGSDPSERQ